MIARPTLLSVALCALSFAAPLPLPLRAADSAPRLELRPAGMELIEEIDVAATAPPREFPQGASRVESALGGSIRMLPNDLPGPKHFGYLIGKGKGLRAGELYVLEIEYPEDKPRSIIVHNRGCETIRGFYTGNTVGDALAAKYVSGNPESLEIPLSGRFERSQTVFQLQDRTSVISWKRGAELPEGETGARVLRPSDGFWVYISQMDPVQDPLNAGAAVSKIRLYKAPAFDQLAQPPRLPPDGLPRRHIFFREEMADDVVGDAKPEKNGFDDANDWYVGKARISRILCMNVLAKDLLEFGANQGWDSTKFGSNSWVYQTPYPQRWARIVETARKFNLGVLPYYEYSGSKGERGLGPQKRAIPLNGENYTHVPWCETARADLTDPDTFEDFRKMLEITVIDQKSRADFVGVWLRPRPSQLPVSFSDAAIARFISETGATPPITRDKLKNDKKLYDAYMQWWRTKRRDFLTKIRDYLRANGVPNAIVLYTCDASEPGAAQPGGARSGLVAENPASWSRVPGLKKPPVPLAQALRERWSFDAQTLPHPTWDKWEWQHAVPRHDPQSYAQLPGVMPTWSFNRAYTVGDASGLAAFTGPTGGLAMIRHYPLNEDMMRLDKALNGKDLDPLGYYTADMDRAGPYTMLAEARAMANGNPTELGYLVSNNFNRAFPVYVRNFNAAFLALPALPSRLVERAASHPDVVVRRIDAPGATPSAPPAGTWLAVVNTGYGEVRDVSIQLPVTDRVRVTNAATGEAVDSTGGVVRLSLYPCQLVALRVETR
ncbi:hypothetical protein DB346_22480 [Verrucomicrobia bacterium LW23]|nr:hypothetical protein DB346_22480 [Verrucomicrobia bacterium LW23]